MSLLWRAGLSLAFAEYSDMDETALFCLALSSTAATVVSYVSPCFSNQARHMRNALNSIRNGQAVSTLYIWIAGPRLD